MLGSKDVKLYKHQQQSKRAFISFAFIQFMFKRTKNYLKIFSQHIVYIKMLPQKPGNTLMKLTMKRNNKRYPSLKSYINDVNKFAGFSMIVREGHYELDSSNKLHYHALVEVRSNYYAKKFIKFYCDKGYHVLLDKFRKDDPKDISGWLDYIRKDQDTITQKLCHYYDNIYLPYKRDCAAEKIQLQQKSYQRANYTPFAASYKDQV